MEAHNAWIPCTSAYLFGWTEDSLRDQRFEESLAPHAVTA